MYIFSMKLTTAHKPNWQGCIEVVIDPSTEDLENKSSNCNLGWKLTSFSKDIKKKKNFGLSSSLVSGHFSGNFDPIVFFLRRLGHLQFKLLTNLG